MQSVAPLFLSTQSHYPSSRAKTFLYAWMTIRYDCRNQWGQKMNHGKPFLVACCLGFVGLFCAVFAQAAPGDVVHQIDAPGHYPNGLAWDGTSLWVNNVLESQNPGNWYKIYRLDPDTGAVLAEFDTTGTIYHGLAWDGSALWADRNVGVSTFIDKLNPKNLIVTQTIDGEGIGGGLAFDPQANVVYLSDNWSNNIRSYDAQTGALVDTISPGTTANGYADMAWDGTHLWQANLKDDAFLRIDPTTGLVVDTLEAPTGQCEGLTFDGTHLWASDTNTDTIYKIEIEIEAAIQDGDKDSVPDEEDNCPTVANPEQKDSDQDTVGDLCDNCTQVANADQADGDSDFVGDVCDQCPDQADPSQPDSDGDGAGNACDNCPSDANADQEDGDSDGLGDVCDLCPDVADPEQADGDSDGIPNACDNCPQDANSLQVDSDNDGVGEACDGCPKLYNADQFDGDSDGVPNACDNCAFKPNADQADEDQDGIGDVCDTPSPTPDSAEPPPMVEPTPDAGPSVDVGTDAGPSVDTSTPPPSPPTSDSGCGCHTVGILPPPGPGTWLLFLMSALIIARLRRQTA